MFHMLYRRDNRASYRRIRKKQADYLFDDIIVYREEQTVDEKYTGSVAETGSLPAQGRLAVSYVPMQKPNSPKYSAADGLKNGTLFPGLNLPLVKSLKGQFKYLVS